MNRNKHWAVVMILAATLGIPGSTRWGESWGSELVTEDQSQLGLGGSPNLGGLELDRDRHSLFWWHVGGGFGSGGEGGGVEGTLGWTRSDYPSRLSPGYRGRGLEVGGAAFDESYIYHTTSRGLARRGWSTGALLPSSLMGRDFATLPGTYHPAAAARWGGEIYFAMWSDDLILDLVPRGRFLIHALPENHYPASDAPDSRLVADGSSDLGTRFGSIVRLGFVTQPIVGGGEVVSGLALAANGDLLRFSPQPIPGLDRAAHRIASGITDFSIRRERTRTGGGLFGEERDVLYLTYQETDSSPSRLVARDPITGAERLLYTAGARVRLTAIGHDSLHLFLSERDVECSLFFGVRLCDVKEGRIRAKTRGDGFRFLIGDEPDANWAVVEEGWGTHLRSDDHHVFFTRGAQIRRFRSDAPPIRVNLKPLALEIVQTVQDLNNSVPLVAGKATFARGYAWVNENSTDRPGWYVRAHLEVRHAGVLLGIVQPVRAGFVDGGTNLYAMRNGTTRDFLFEIPMAWVQPGELTLSFVVNPDGGVPEQGPGVAFDNHRTATLQIVQSSPIEVQIRPVEAIRTINYNPLTDPGFPSILSRALSLLPVPELRWSFLPQVVTGPYDPADDDEWSDALGELAAGSLFEALTRRDAPLFRAGAFGYGSPRRPGANMFGLGRRPGRALVFRVDDEAGGFLPFGVPFSGAVLAHELGHNLDVKHVNNAFTTAPLVPSACADFFPKGPFEPYPYDGCGFGIPSFIAASNLIQRFDLPYGFDSVLRQPVSPWAAGDLMSYRGQTWTSPYTWRRLLQGIPGAQPASPFARAIQAAQRPRPADLEQLTGPVVLLQGFLDRSTGQCVVKQCLRLPPGWLEPGQIQLSLDRMAASGSEWKIVLQDETGAALAIYPLVAEPADEGETQRETILMLLPDADTTARLAVLNPAGEVVAERAASANAPAIEASALPSVDETLGELVLDLQLSDADGDEPAAIVQYSNDAGATWQLVGQGVRTGPITLSTRFLPGGESCQLRIVASDGFRSSAWVSEAFAVAPHAPELVARGLTDGAVLDFGTELVLEAAGFDAEDGGRPDLAFSWEVVGNTVRVVNSAHLVAHDLAPGHYTATATLYDSEGNATRQTFQFQIRPAVVPEGAAVPRVDGEISDLAYHEALSLPLPPEASARVRLVHVPPYLYVAATGLRQRDLANPAVLRLSLNLQGAGQGVPGETDLRFNLDETGQLWAETGNGTEFVADASREGSVLGAVTRGAQEWSAELRIHEHALGGWDHLVTLALDHDYLLTPIPSQTSWPPDVGTPNIPSTWAPVALGLESVPQEIRLSANRQEDGSVELTWPPAGAACRVESSPSLSEPIWEMVEPQPLEGTTLLIIPADASARFYRLRCP